MPASAPRQKNRTPSQSAGRKGKLLYERSISILNSYKCGKIKDVLPIEVQQTARYDRSSEFELFKIKNDAFVAACILLQAVIELKEISRNSKAAAFILAVLNNSISEIEFVGVRLRSIIYCIIEYCKNENLEDVECNIFSSFVVPVLMRVSGSCKSDTFTAVSRTRRRDIERSSGIIQPQFVGDMINVSASYAFSWPSVEHCGTYDYTPWRMGTRISTGNEFRLSDWGYRVSGVVQDPQRPKILNQIILSGSNQFGTHHSIVMLKMVAYTIASFVRRAKGRQDDMSESIRIWEHDLNKLQERYYARLRFVL